MVVDAGHRIWAAATVAALGAGAIAYGVHAVRSPTGPSGGSALGLIYGFVAFGLMVFAGLLGGRKKVPTWRLGRAATWLKGHIWLSLLAVALVFFHAGFRLGGPMTTALVVLTVVVGASGLYGLGLQHVLPRLLTAEVPSETVAARIGDVVDRLREEAEARVAEAGEALSEVHGRVVQPFLARRFERSSPLARPHEAEAFFRSWAGSVAVELRGTVADLEAICAERRQLAVQARMHRWLHGWLLVHVPLSYGLLVLAAAHAVIALRY
jgi:hypothetical protein